MDRLRIHSPRANLLSPSKVGKEGGIELTFSYNNAPKASARMNCCLTIESGQRKLFERETDWGGGAISKNGRRRKFLGTARFDVKHAVRRLDLFNC
jgi:hypothetical protein